MKALNARQRVRTRSNGVRQGKCKEHSEGHKSRSSDVLTDNAMKQRRNRRGQALIETALTITLLLLVVLGIVEFGYVFFALHMVENAGRDGARAAAALQNRGPCGAISDSSSIAPLVTSEINGIVSVDGSTSGGCNCSTGVCVQQCVAAADGTTTCATPPASNCPAFTGTDIPIVQVTVAGHIPDIFSLLGGTPRVFCRKVSFRDEGR